mmetsp:Transcript_18714/g.28415  ORF Transcript_18714/g.28415 Transcript_18714/m.28415 type:complete len:365 (-) Transcript_18714:494-1588(-)
MKRMVGGAFSSVTSTMMAWSRSSNSPRYLVPATRLANSNVTTRYPLRRAGHWDARIFNRSIRACSINCPSSSRSKISSALAIILGAARICAIPSAMAVFPTPGSPVRQGLFLRLRTNVRSEERISSSRPYTSSNSPSMAAWVRSVPHSLSVGVALSPFFPPLTNSISSSSISLISETRVRQNSVAEKSSPNPSICMRTANAPRAYPSSSSLAPASLLFSDSQSRSASKTCSELIVALPVVVPIFVLSATFPAAFSVLFNPGLNGNSTSLAFLFILNILPKLLLPESSPTPSPSGWNISSAVRRILRRVMPYFCRVLRAFSGRSMIPMVMISVPTMGCPRRAASFWAVTSAPMHSSDMRSKIMDN